MGCSSRGVGQDRRQILGMSVRLGSISTLWRVDLPNPCCYNESRRSVSANLKLLELSWAIDSLEAALSTLPDQCAAGSGIEGRCAEVCVMSTDEV